MRETLRCESKGYKYRIKFENDIMVYQERNIRKNNCCYKPLQWISDYVTLVQLMETSGNVNHTLIIDEHWLYDSNKKNIIYYY